MPTVLTESKPAAAPALPRNVPALDDLAEHARYIIANTPVRAHPYPHLYAEGVFPSAWYQRMLDAFPLESELRPLNDKFPRRLSLSLSTPGAIDGLAPERRAFWQEVADRLFDPQTLDFLVRRFSPEVADRCAGRLHPMVHLFHDAGGYGIGPHIDTFKKVVTCLFYLPQDDSARAWGTSVLTRTGDPAAPLAPHHLNDWTGFASAYTAPMLPNTMLAFLVTSRSYHAVRPTPPGIVRRSLQYFVTIDE
jgi:hypothetical protein